LLNKYQNKKGKEGVKISLKSFIILTQISSNKEKRKKFMN